MPRADATRLTLLVSGARPRICTRHDKRTTAAAADTGCRMLLEEMRATLLWVPEAARTVARTLRGAVRMTRDDDSAMTVRAVAMARQ